MAASDETTATLHWDGGGYHRVSTVQEKWGVGLVRRIPARRYSKILDAGCGSGRVTAHLLRAFPRSRVVALDRSSDMLCQAARTLRRFSKRLTLLRADLRNARPGSDFDLVFSNATFHWVQDHRRLFRNLHCWLAPGGRLEAQCGGKGNLRRIEALISSLSASRRFRPYLATFRRPVNFASPGSTRHLLERAGFREVQAWLTAAPTPFASRREFCEFARYVTLVPVLSVLPSDETRAEYLESFVALYERRHGRRYLFDYVRLNIRAVRR